MTCTLEMRKSNQSISVFKLFLLLFFLVLRMISFCQNDSVKLKTNATLNNEKTKLFYNNIKKKTLNNKVLTEIHSLIFISSDTNTSKKQPQESHIRFLNQKGKTIRSISFVRLDVFGPTVDDTTLIKQPWITQTANKMHVYTRQNELKKMLLIHEGDTINPLLLSDNEHLFKKSPFIKDARIVLLPDFADTTLTDVVVITQDIYPVGVIIKQGSFKQTKVGIYNMNLWGLGHLQRNLFLLNPLSSEKIRFSEGEYRIENISNLFLSGEVDYVNYPDNKSIGINFDKKFITSNTKYAGGISFQHNYELTKENDLPLLEDKYNNFNSWFGYAIPLRVSSFESYNRKNLILSVGMDKIQYLNRIFYEQTSYLKPFNQTLILLGASISTNAFYRDNLLFGYGSSEDIPYGKLFGCQFGYSFDENKKRLYAEYNYSFGTKILKLGYINLNFEVGSYYYINHLEDGIVKSKISFASKLYTHYYHHYRHYININYARGINMIGSERIIINDKYGIRGLKSNTLTGTQKLSMNLESVMFSPFYVLGFRFSTFSFFDIGFIGEESRFIFNQKMYSGLGIGIRIKNENLVFNTFQLRFAFYPLEPERSSRFSVDVSGFPSAGFSDFTVKQPHAVTFE